MNNTSDWFSAHYSDNVILSVKIKDSIVSLHSEYQKIEVLDSYDFGRMLVLDNVINVTERDEFIYHEMIAHVPMSTHPEPNDILVIGGGDGGTARELLKYPSVRKITLVEIDEKVIDAAKKFFPDLACSFRNKKLDLKIQDGIDFVEGCPESSFDLVIIDSNDPVGPAKGLFSEEFYKRVHGILKENGLLITQSESPRFNPHVFREIYQCYYKIFGKQQVFCFLAHIPTYPTGMWSFSYCSKDRNLHPLRSLNEDLIKRLIGKNALKYYNQEVHAGAFALPNFVLDLLN